MSVIHATCPIDKYASFGRCVYCGETANLTDEHIIPFGLHGYQEIVKGSCVACQDITKRFEEDCLKKMFGPARYHLNLRTRRPKERPTSLPAKVVSQMGVRNVNVRLSDHPFALVLPVYPPPGGLWSPIAITNHDKFAFFFAGVQPDLQARVNRLASTGDKIRLAIHYTSSIVFPNDGQDRAYPCGCAVLKRKHVVR